MNEKTQHHTEFGKEEIGSVFIKVDTCGKIVVLSIVDK